MTESAAAVATRLTEIRTPFPLFIDDSEAEDLDFRLLKTGINTVWFDGRSGRPSLIDQLITRGDAPSWTGDSWEALWDVLDEVREAWTTPVCLIGRRIDLAAAADLATTTDLVGMTHLLARDLSAMGPAVHAILTVNS